MEETGSPDAPVRLVQLVVLQLFITPVLFLILRVRLPVLFFMLLITSLVALTASTDWTPSVFTAVLLPFAVGSLPGLLLGAVILNAFDHLRGEEGETTGTLSTPADMRRLVMLGLFLLLIGLHILVVAVNASALVAVSLVHSFGAIPIFVAFFLINRNAPLTRRAWAVYGGVYMVGTLVTALVMIFTASLFWTFLFIALYYCIALLAVFVSTMIASNDVRAALFNLASGTTTASTPLPTAGIPNVPSNVAASHVFDGRYESAVPAAATVVNGNPYMPVSSGPSTQMGGGPSPMASSTAAATATLNSVKQSTEFDLFSFFGSNNVKK